MVLKKIKEGNVIDKVTLDVNSSYFKLGNAKTSLTKVPCTLSDGTETECYKITTSSTPEDHQMGPWCPENISDDALAGGIWLKDGKVYDVDGAFVKYLAAFYGDTLGKCTTTRGIFL